MTKIYAVDDNSDYLKSLQELLKLIGYEARLFQSSNAFNDELPEIIEKGQLKIINKNAPDAHRIYDSSGNARTLKSEGGGMGAKTGLYAIPFVNNKGVLETRENVNCLVTSYHKGLDGHAQNTGIAVPVLTPNRPEKRQNGRRFKEDGDPMFTLTTQDKHGIFDGYRIRRLTPKETERLQGLPDDWTKYGIDENGDPVNISDSQRYRMTGNGVTVSVVDAIIKRILK